MQTDAVIWEEEKREQQQKKTYFLAKTKYSKKLLNYLEFFLIFIKSSYCSFAYERNINFLNNIFVVALIRFCKFILIFDLNKQTNKNTTV